MIGVVRKGDRFEYRDVKEQPVRAALLMLKEKSLKEKSPLSAEETHKTGPLFPACIPA